MELETYQQKILELLIDHEEGMSELYKIYAEKFQAYHQLWDTLSQEELVHADWVKKLKDMVEKGTVYFDEKRFTQQALESSLSELKSEIAKARQSELPLISALSAGYYFETAFIERKFYEVFEGDSVELKHTLLDLGKSTENHQSRIKEALAIEREKKDKL